MWLRYPGVEETLNKACSQVAKIMADEKDDEEERERQEVNFEEFEEALKIEREEK